MSVACLTKAWMSGLDGPDDARVRQPATTDIPISAFEKGDAALADQKELERFLASVERRAFRMAEISTGNRSDALDIVQDAMFKLVQKYARRPAAEWGPLFQTILQSRIMDYHRRNTVRNRYFSSWFGGGEDDDYDPIQTAVDEHTPAPEDSLDQEAGMVVLDEAVRQLPLRQQQAFMLRALEGLDVAQTARVMKCSEGSVKTHYFRALTNLRQKLEDYRL